VEASKKFSIFEDMGSKAASIDNELFLAFRDWVSPRHVHNWIDNDIFFCIFSDLDITVNYFVFLITLLIVGLSCTLFLDLSQITWRMIVTSGVNSEVADMLSVSEGISFCFVEAETSLNNFEL